jgi:hypothetical protein
LFPLIDDDENDENDNDDDNDGGSFHCVDSDDGDSDSPACCPVFRTVPTRMHRTVHRHLAKRHVESVL